MENIYIATPTQADYDALIRLAEAAGFEWASGNKMSEEPNNYLDEREETVIHLDARLHEIWYDNPRRYEGKIIERIPNLADIKAIWRVQPDDHKAFFKGKSYNHPLPSDESVIMLEMTDGLTGGLLDIHKALAVEYKPKESEDIIPEKVKLPKRLYDALQDYGLPEDGNESWPVFAISALRDYWKESESSILGTFIDENADNQWKLIDALRYGYEPEPEPRWAIKAGNCYMTNPDNYGFDDVTPETAIENDAYWGIKSYADDIVKTLGFGEVVDLNKEDDAND